MCSAFNMNRILFLLYQCNPHTILGGAISEVLPKAKYSELVELLQEIREMLTLVPEIFEKVLKAEEIEELKEMILQ
jgi:hypothetical protein